ncbi:hypothetical protein LTR85_007398 [Meristemomyces frigidus]|nr:hypothetical protein LTR85_007398 [Meristemomyces frigidus]
MDPLTAVGLAASVVQFVQFGVSILSKSKEIQRSASGSSAENADLEIVENDLSRWTSKLSSAIAPAAVLTALNEDDQRVVQLCARCILISGQLRTALESVRLKGRKTGWKTVRTALKSVWKKEAIEGLKDRLIIIRDELESRIIAGLRSSIDFVQLKQLEGFAGLDKAVRDLAESWWDSQTLLKKDIEHQTAHIDASVLASALNINLAVTASSQRSDEAHTRTLSRIAQQDQETRAQQDIFKGEVTRQWLSAEVQIAQLKEEVMELKATVAAAVDKVMEAYTDPKRQKALQVQTNVLYKVWVTKQVMLDKLQEFVAKIKARLYGGEWIFRLPAITLAEDEGLGGCPSTTPPDNGTSPEWITHRQVITLQQDQDLVRLLSTTPQDKGLPPELSLQSGVQCAVLMSAIRSADVGLCAKLATKHVVNCDMMLPFPDFKDLDSSARQFYSTMYPHTPERWPNGVEKRREDPVPKFLPGFELRTTPLLCTVLQFRLTGYRFDTLPHSTLAQIAEERDTRWAELLAVLDCLLEAGADLRILDNAGLSACDHARFLGLDQQVVDRLRPHNHFDGEPIPFPELCA